MPTPSPQNPISRRALLGSGLTAAGLAALSACSADPTSPALVAPTGRAVAAAERARRSTGVVRTATLRAQQTTIDLAGSTSPTWSYGTVPAPLIRANAGDTVRATLHNQLDVPTSVHWHGVAIRNDMDGVPPITQPAVQPGHRFTYDFIAEHPGTYWFHPHVGTQIDRGLYGALIVDDPSEPGRYDAEWVIVLDDWLDTAPEAVLQQLSKGMSPMGGMAGMTMRDGNMLMGAESSLLKGDAGDVFYPRYLINGHPTNDPATFRSKPGDRVRIRLINAGGDTAFRVALGGHALTVTHTDGYPVEPVEVDSILLGMGERYDAIVTLTSGVFPLVASAEGKGAAGFAVVRTASGRAPSPTHSIPELGGRVAQAADLHAATSVRLPDQRLDRTITLTMTGSMDKYDWAINGQRFDHEAPLRNAETIRTGERIRLRFANRTTMWHPMHLHGHTYQHTGGGPRKDTSIVLPGQTVTVDFDADNPGRWITHCHNIYHAEAGMMAVLAYTA
ncbi:multicopper oxidase family protein [Amnibacterium sp.]|uniref:multicopper oxidase family protein n=1 Tax=Amnibacterium sp. TaxID=1872496 RepID=UPI003F7BE095